MAAASFTLASVTVAALIFVLDPLALKDVQEDGIVISMLGDTTLIRQGKASGPLQLRERLHKEDTITTGNNS